MSEFWPHWLRPIWLLLLPLLAWLLWRLRHRRRRAGRWELLLPPAFQAVLLDRAEQRESRLPRFALALAWLLGLLALLGPSWQQVEHPTGKRAAPLVVLLQMTPSMLAGDAAPNRLEQAKHKLLDLLEARRESQTAVVVYAGSAHVLVPLSDDLGTIRNLLDALQPSLMPVAGQRADLALDKGMGLLEQGAPEQPGQVLLITSTLDETERQGIVKRLGRHGERLKILGIGTPQGAPIPLADGGFLKDGQGAILLPRLDNTGLARFAARVGGRYQTTSLDDRDLRRLGLLAPPSQLREGHEPASRMTWADQGHWLLLPLLLLAACAGRRGWLFCLPLLLALPFPSHAFDFADLWARPDQQGQRLLEAGNPAEAAKRFEDRQWQGLALYRAGDYAAAAERFGEGHDAAAHYNRGNALARHGKLEAALDAYVQALALRPGMAQAEKNKALVEALLHPREESETQPSGKSDAALPADSGTPPRPTPSSAGAERIPSETPPSTASRGDSGASDRPAAPDSPAAPPSGPANEVPDELGEEQRQALEQWLRQIPDDPGELLRRKFWYEQRQPREARP